MTEAERYAGGETPSKALQATIDRVQTASDDLAERFEEARARGAAPADWNHDERAWPGLSEPEYDEVMEQNTLAYAYHTFRDGSKVEVRVAKAGADVKIRRVDAAGRYLDRK